MFVPCPHCGFLVALIVSREGPAPACPRCHQPLQTQSSADDHADDHADMPGDMPSKSPLNPPERQVDAGAIADAIAIDSAPAGATPHDTGNPVATVEPTAPANAKAAIAAVTSRTAGSTRISRRTGPSFARVPVSAGARTSHWPAVLAVVLLTALLLLQLLLAQRAELAADARWRPWIASVCGVLGCTLPTWHEPDAYTMLDRSVQPPPGRNGVLNVSASFRNDARWPQAWPTLLLSLSDVDGRQVAGRAFTPVEYHAPSQKGELLAPGQSASVRFEVIEPAPRIVAFTFDFR